MSLDPRKYVKEENLSLLLWLLVSEEDMSDPTVLLSTEDCILYGKMKIFLLKIFASII